LRWFATIEFIQVVAERFCSLKIRLLKMIDRLIGAIAVFCLPRPRAVALTEPNRILLIRPGGIGDAVLLLPAIRALHAKFPGCDITVLAEKRNGAIFSLCGLVGRTLLYDHLPDLRKAFRDSYDVVIDTEQWHRLSAVFARFTGAPVLIGFATNGRRRLFTHTIEYSHDTYEAESFLSLLVPLGCSAAALDETPFLEVPEAAIQRADDLLASLDTRPFIALFPGASIPERRWGGDRFRDLAQRLSRHALPVVAVGGGGDAVAGEMIVADGLGLNLAGKTSLAETAAVLRRSSLLVTGDSGLLHMAVALAVPTVSLFGPGIAKKWAPRGSGHYVLNKNLDCSPCTRFGYTPTCRIGARCLAELEVAQVEDAVMSLLGR
jgi:ADP-heptose:LPS heptosyltransferase